MSGGATVEAPLLSVVVATRNRPQGLRHLLSDLHSQQLTPALYEVVVVDDGSTPPVKLDTGPLPASTRLVRLEGVERCRARNAGAEAARGTYLLFMDDDMRLQPGLLAAHLAAHGVVVPETPSPAPAGAAGRPRDLMVIGAVHLPASWGDSPFGRFRIATDSGDWPATEAPGSEAAFCTAQNMSLPRELFLRLGGFDVELISSEDQDLGWRVIEAGGQVAFCRAAAAEHHDGARDIRSYCRRVEWGTVWQVPYARKRPLLESSRKRAAVNGPPRPGREPWKRSALKALKSLLGVRPLRELLFALVWLLEHCRAPQGLLHRLYYLLVGIHLQRGWRQGLARWGPLA